MAKCFVYFIKADTGRKNYPMKIGVAYDPVKRMGELQVGNPYRLSILSCVEMSSRKAAYDLELFLHKRFDFLRMEGEWFSSRKINLGKAFDEYSKIGGKAKFFNGDISAMSSKKKTEIERLRKQNEILTRQLDRMQSDIDEALDEGYLKLVRVFN